ncbi:hypothetical protein J31TS6_05000 [Brevibacillus reuszeri]|uniref:hypothetical protein n=1 Tax=Brevibacillus reuszeri TaxID=54915 RepID=UPI001B0BEA4C|nr:hypothetical protein [Brevibacillus reuszeri]GIO04472.1 hypothetical protein J31TS6_05000 [Brevibacillus reuszeri]
MENSDKHEGQAGQKTTSELNEKEIELQHQYQMFPTPDEKRASKVITELKD